MINYHQFLEICYTVGCSNKKILKFVHKHYRKFSSEPRMPTGGHNYSYVKQVNKLVTVGALLLYYNIFYRSLEEEFKKNIQEMAKEWKNLKYATA